MEPILLDLTPAVDPDPRLHEVKTTDADPALPADHRRLICLRLHWEAARDDAPFVHPAEVIAALATDDVHWTRDDLIWSLRVLAGETGRDDGSPWRLPVIIGAALPPEELRDLVPAFEAVLDAVKTSYLAVRVRHSLSQAYGAVLDRIDPGGLGHVLPADDVFDAAVQESLRPLLTDAGMRAVLRHAESLAKPVPAKGWLRRADDLRGAAGVVNPLLERFCAYQGSVGEDTDLLVRGLIWFAARDPESTALLARVAVRAGTASSEVQAPRTAAAAVEILADRGGDAPVRALVRLALTVRSKPLLARVRAAVARIESARGWAAGEALELGIDDHGLDAEGRRCWPVPGSVLVEVVDGRARLVVMRDGRPLKRVPADVDVAEARALVKEITKTLAAERDRVESLLSQERSWAWADWVARYLDHPITGSVADRLIWQSSVDGRAWRAGIPRREADGGWRLVDEAGNDFEPAGGRVRLWHPALAAPGEAARWRDHIGVEELRQPFKQAFREVYPLTPAEASSRTSSRRFAGHILRYRQANALMRTRGWAASYLGTWDQGHRTEASKDLGGGEWRALLVHEAAGEADYQVVYCILGEVRFTRRAGGAWQDAPLTEVPVRVFSEAMRDVDLFVGVTSIAADEAWQDRGTSRFRAYRESAGFGALTASAEVRRDVLARLLPRLSIGPRCELTERYLRVRGQRGTYRIHLGSANILIEPDDTYLCIVPDHKRKPAVHLPFDDDRVLSLILSKAILLAADDTITDPTIVAQLPAVPPPP
ncbi:DUF4132 domain-containing protein [Actinoplanes sp. CA-051413]|uniref:DUF4132 domain-containing protein n=1 Tax=Actinoplanes sp. CA-051413 TaxID=3239899 RepID=UPI003D988B53